MTLYAPFLPVGGLKAPCNYVLYNRPVCDTKVVKRLDGFNPDRLLQKAGNVADVARKMRAQRGMGPPAPAADNIPVRRAEDAAAALWHAYGPSAITFGAVAQAADITKSLVSHHFATHARLLESGADIVVTGARHDFDRMLEALRPLPPEMRSSLDTLAYIVEHLVGAETRPGVVLLELASLGLAEPAYRERFGELLDRLEAAMAENAPAGSRSFLTAFVLGELISHCPKRHGVVSLAGLRERLRWFVGNGSAEERRWLLVLHELLGKYGHEIRPQPVARPQPVKEMDGTLAQNRIVTAALDVLADGDVAEMTHRKIADRARVSLAATTYYFESKRAILEAAYRQIIQLAEAEARQITKAPRAGDGSAFHDLIARMANYYVNEGRRSTLAHFRLALSACRSDDLSSFAAEAHRTEITTLIARAQADGMTLSYNLACAIISFISGTVLLRLTGMIE